MSLLILFKIIYSVCPAFGIYHAGNFIYKGDVSYSDKLPAIEEIMGPCDADTFLKCIKHPQCKAIEMCDLNERKLCRLCGYTNPTFTKNAKDPCRHLQLNKKVNDEKQLCSIGSGRNVALNKPVTLSSLYESAVEATKGRNAVDGSFHNVAHTGYEKRPWLMISLENLYTIEKVVMYNRRDGHGWWLHDVEIRVGQTKDWDQMSTCGTFVGESDTGLNHTVVCSECLLSRYVTLKIMKDNNVTTTRSDGLNTLTVTEIEVF